MRRSDRPRFCWIADNLYRIYCSIAVSIVVGYTLYDHWPLP